MRADKPHAICGATTRSGKPCQARPMANGRCRMHGGKSLAGPASPAFKTGRYSKYLPARLTERYAEAVNDPELLALREDVALIDARLADLLRRVDSGESGQLWKDVRQAYQSFIKARRRGDDEAAAAAFDELGELIERGASDHAAWSEIAALLEQRRRLVESERRRLVEMQQVITAEQAMVLIAAVVDVVRKHVSDRHILSAISRDIGALTARNDPGAARS